MPRLGAQGLLTFIGCILLNGCSLLLGDIPGPIDPRTDVDGAAPTDGDAGLQSTDSTVGETVASGEAGAPTVPESDDTSGLEEEAPVSEDTAATDVEALADASSSNPEDPGDAENVESDGTGAEDAASDSCDSDDDGAKSEACGGQDCDDTDANVHPGQTRYFVAPNKSGEFDYDCSGLIDRDPSESSLSCALELAQCDPTAQGFMGETLPECGKQADWGQCAQEQVVGLPGMCVAQKLEDRRAGCR